MEFTTEMTAIELWGAVYKAEQAIRDSTWRIESQEDTKTRYTEELARRASEVSKIIGKDITNEQYVQLARLLHL